MKLRKLLLCLFAGSAFGLTFGQQVEILRESFGNTGWYYGPADGYTNYISPISVGTQTAKFQNWNPSTYVGASGEAHFILSPADGATPTSEFEFTINTTGYQNIQFGLGTFSWGAAADHFVFEYSTNGVDYTAISNTNLASGAWGANAVWSFVKFATALPEAENLRIKIKVGTTEQIHFDDVVVFAEPIPAEVYKAVIFDNETVFAQQGVTPGKVNTFGLTNHQVVDNPLVGAENPSAKVLKVTRPAGSWQILGFEFPGGIPVEAVESIQFQVYGTYLRSAYSKAIGGKETVSNKDSVFSSISSPWLKTSSAVGAPDIDSTKWNTITLNMYEANEDYKVLSGPGKIKLIQVFINPTSKSAPGSSWYGYYLNIDQNDYYIDNLVINLNQEIPLDSINLGNVNITIGNSSRVVPAIFPIYTSESRDFDWSVGDENIATIDTTGLITSVAIGSTTYQLSLGDEVDQANVTVNPVAVTGVSLDEATAELEEGETLQLTATVAPANATDKSVSWSTSDVDIATVVDGMVTAVAVGNVDIVVTTTDGSYTDTCKISVVPVAVTGVSLDVAAAELEEGETLQLTATVEPADAADPSVEWSSSSDVVATVSAAGLVSAIAAGEATITVTTVDGDFTDECVVTVTEPVSGISDLKDNKVVVAAIGKQLVITTSVKGKARVYSASGKLMAEKELVAGQNYLNVAELKSGNYIVKVSGYKKPVSVKFNLK